MDPAAAQLQQLNQEVANATAEVQKAWEAYFAAEPGVGKEDLKLLWKSEEENKMALLLERKDFEARLTVTGTTPQWAEAAVKQLEGINQKVDHLAKDLVTSMAPICASLIGRTLESKTGSESSSTKQRQKHFKLDLIQAYQHPCVKLPKKIQCMISGLKLESEIVLAAHLVAKSAEREGRMFYGIDSVWNARNGLLWAEPFEQAFQQNQACIMYKPDFSEYVYVVLDKDIINKPLSDLATLAKAKADLQLQRMTFAQCDQQPLRNPRKFEPFSRVLAAHGALSVHVMRGLHKLREDMSFAAEDFEIKSEFEAAPTVRSYIQTQLH